MSSEFINDLRAEAGRHRAETEANQVPKGWEAHVDTIGQIGNAVLHLPTPGATNRDLLLTSGFDPSEWQIDGPVQTRKWMRYDQEWLYYYKFNVKQGEAPEDREIHIQDLVEQIRQRPSGPIVGAIDPKYYTYLVALADFQTGKVVGSFGTPELIQRFKRLIDLSVQNYKESHRGSPVALVGLGDLIERCDGHYKNQAFSTDLNHRDQLRVTRELIYYAIDSFREVAPAVTIACVGGNHGENRQGERGVVTNNADNEDVSVFETIKEAYDRAEVPNLTWIIPQEELLVNLELSGIKIAITHGHLFKAGANAGAKAENYWKSQVFGYQTDAQILLHGHFHHHTITTYGKRTAIQAPALDGGSDWYRNTSGEESVAGLLTMVIDPNAPLGWSDVKVIWA